MNVWWQNIKILKSICLCLQFWHLKTCWKTIYLQTAVIFLLESTQTVLVLISILVQEMPFITKTVWNSELVCRLPTKRLNGYCLSNGNQLADQHFNKFTESRSQEVSFHSNGDFSDFIQHSNSQEFRGYWSGVQVLRGISHQKQKCDIMQSHAVISHSAFPLHGPFLPGGA